VEAVKRRAPVLSHEHWHAIVAATRRLPDSADLKKARREVARTLRAYQGFPSRAGLARTRVRWRLHAKRAIKLHEGLISDWRQKRITYDFFWDYALRDLRERAKIVIVEGLDVHLAARKGRRDPPREWLYWRLLSVWTDHLGGKLGASSTESGGPAVRFIRVACALVGVTPSVPTVRAIIKAERLARRGRDISVAPK